METIPKADCEKIGFFRKTHGVHGDVILEFESQYDYSVEEANRFFVELEGLLVPFFIREDGFRIKNSTSAIVSFDDVETEKYAKRLIGCSVYLFKTEIIDDPEDSSVSELVNYIVKDEKGNKIGKIIEVDDYSGNIVFTVNYDGSEILIPFNEDLLIEINDNLKTIQIQIPEGLIDL
jgi:16S rRNA processing protein RimM